MKKCRKHTVYKEPTSNQLFKNRVKKHDLSEYFLKRAKNRLIIQEKQCYLQRQIRHFQIECKNRSHFGYKQVTSVPVKLSIVSCFCSTLKEGPSKTQTLCPRENMSQIFHLNIPVFCFVLFFSLKTLLLLQVPLCCAQSSIT